MLTSNIILFIIILIVFTLVFTITCLIAKKLRIIFRKRSQVTLLAPVQLNLVENAPLRPEVQWVEIPKIQPSRLQNLRVQNSHSHLQAQQYRKVPSSSFRIHNQLSFYFLIKKLSEHTS